MNREAQAQALATRKAELAAADGVIGTDAPPQDVAAERVILCEGLNHAEAYRACAEAGLEPQHFHLPLHQRIFRAMRKASADHGVMPTTISTWAALEALGLTEGDHGVERLTLDALAEGKTNPAAIAPTIERVMAMATKRAKLAGAKKVIAGVGTVEEAKGSELIQEGLAEIASDHTIEAEPTSREELADFYFDYLESEEPAEFWPLPWDELNECVSGGYRRGQMSVLAGWSEMGKSWALDQMFMGFFEKKGLRTAIFATEMEKSERLSRFVTMKTGVPLRGLLTKNLKAAQYQAAVGALPKIPYDFFEVNGWGVDRICQRIIFGGYDVVGIDVVNLIPGFEEKVEHASRIVTAFTNVARRARCHVVLVAHLNKERDKGAEKPRPVKRDLKNTGSLETHAHQILFVHRDQDSKGTPLEAGEIFFAKVRNGTKGYVHVRQDPRTLTFEVDPFGGVEQQLGAAV